MSILLLILVILFAYSIYVYNKSLYFHNLSMEAEKNIDVHLKERSNIIPNLVNIVKGFADYEQSTQKLVAELRTKSSSSTSLSESVKTENELVKAIGSINLLVEAYPELKADENFTKLQDSLVDMEDEIESSRRYYNGTVRNLNYFIEKFPNNILANLFNMKKKEFFEIDYLAKANVQVDF